jgi:putative transposase
MPLKTYYRNRLPHIAPPGSTFFVTFRLADALPAHLVAQLKGALYAELDQIEKENPPNKVEKFFAAKKRHFGKYDKQLDFEPYGSCYLRQKEVAGAVAHQLHAYHGQLYDLQAYCIMPNHVHLLIDTGIQLTEKDDFYGEIPENYVQLDKIMQRLKGASARYANIFLQRTGEPFWQKDSYDHYVRHGREWERIEAYILNNPVKAGLVKDWRDWPFTYRTGDFSRRRRHFGD